MTDWPGQIARGRRLAEALAWLASGALVALVMAMGAALALWLPPMQGREVPESAVMVIDLTPLPPAPALAEQPEAAPVAPPPVAEPEPQPLPEPEPEPEPEPKPLPKPEPAPAPKPAPVAKPYSAPVAAKPEPPKQAAPKKAERPAAKPREKPAVKPKAAAKSEPAAEPKAASPKAQKPAQAGASASARGSASPDALAAWKRKVAAQLDRHLRRKSLGARAARLTATLRIDGGGTILGVSLAQSSGNAALDARVTAVLAAKGAVAAPPDGRPATLTVPVALR